MRTQWMMKSKLGPLYLVASEKGLRGVYIEKQELPLLKDLNVKVPGVKFLSQANRELTEYFSGSRKKFSVALDFEGTEFQTKVWKALSEIPYGKTCSYQDIAMKIKNQKAVRAVGNANGKNPLCIIIPCHRVIASDGSLGGYSGGLHIKIQLLELENAKWAQRAK